MEQNLETCLGEAITLERKRTYGQEIKTKITKKNEHGFYEIEGYIETIVLWLEGKNVIFIWEDGVVKMGELNPKVRLGELKLGKAVLHCRCGRIDKITWL